MVANVRPLLALSRHALDCLQMDPNGQSRLAFNLVCRSPVPEPSRQSVRLYAPCSSIALKSARARCASRRAASDASLSRRPGGAWLVRPRLEAHRRRLRPRLAKDRTTPCKRPPARAQQGFSRAKRASRRHPWDRVRADGTIILRLGPDAFCERAQRARGERKSDRWIRHFPRRPRAREPAQTCRHPPR